MADIEALAKLSLAHLLVLRSRLGVFWSRSLHVLDIDSTLGTLTSDSVVLKSVEVESTLKHFYHLSLPTYNSSMFTV